ncbi:MAG: hypothetical protein EOP13_00305 [Pseudomonas sp.]|uniref:hypothetical protein n=1 Tax=Pseudomonas sp. TaxID=306 RepID=UPI001212199F|nr:hypothetical protein [Pseudomonas sp.]RZI76962.1 MAG: hypothetical protein EOP13_00305 [Pseudomonas sp.]
MKKALIASLWLVGLSACDATEKPAATSGEVVADRLEKAADQSGPAAKKVLENAADEARAHPSMAPVDQPGSFAQDAMQRAGNAEASTAGKTQDAPLKK